MKLDQGWLLDPRVTYLNHGSLGACPLPVLEETHRWRVELERQPIQFLLRDMKPRLAAVREKLAGLIGCDPDDLALMPNAESCVNAVLRSLDIGPGDELLATTHDYNACLNSLDFVAARSGATVVRADVPYPIEDPAEVMSSVMAQVTPRTRLAMVSHITSATALIFPISEIVSELESRGIRVLVDGAHAPGQVNLDLDALGASYYAGNCHKWLCGPKGTGFLHVRRDRKEEVHPLIISNGMNDPQPDLSQFRKEFDWQGVVDTSGYLSIPSAIDFLQALAPGGISEVASRNHVLALTARDRLCPILRIDSPAPDEMIPSMVSLPVDDLAPRGDDRMKLELMLREEHNIEVPFLRWRPVPGVEKWAIRVSCQAYNDTGDIEAMADALSASIAALRL